MNVSKTHHVTAEFKDIIIIVAQHALILMGDLHADAVEAIMSRAKHCVQVIGIVMIMIIVIIIIAKGIKSLQVTLACVNSDTA